MARRGTAAACLVAALLVAAGPTPAQAQCNVAAILQSANLTSLLAAVSGVPGIAATLNTLASTAPGITVFAPTNAAFTNLVGALDGYTPASVTLGTLVSTNATQSVTSLVLQYHAIAGVVPSSALPTGATSVPTLASSFSNLTVTKGAAGVSVSAAASTANVVTADAYPAGGLCPNLAVHIVDTVLLPVGLQAAAGLYGLPPPPCDLTQVLAAVPALSSLAAAVNGVPAVRTLLNSTTSATPLTIFAPNNTAFAATLAALDSLTNPGTVTLGALIGSPAATAVTANLLSYHVLPAFAPAANVTTGTFSTLLPNAPVNVTVNSGAVSVAGAGSTARVVAANAYVNTTCNVAVHIVDTVILPFTASQALTAYGLPACTPLTGPANLPGASTFFAVLPMAFSPAEIQQLTQMKATIFVPTDAAFMKLLTALGGPNATQSALTSLPNVATVLKALLSYHVVPGPGVLSTSLAATQTVPTVLGTYPASAGLPAVPTTTLTVNKNATGVTVVAPASAARVVQADQGFCNQLVVHTVDTVLLPAPLSAFLPSPPPPPPSPSPPPKVASSGAIAAARALPVVSVLALLVATALAAAF